MTPKPALCHLSAPLTVSSPASFSHTGLTPSEHTRLTSPSGTLRGWAPLLGRLSTRFLSASLPYFQVCALMSPSLWTLFWLLAFKFANTFPELQISLTFPAFFHNTYYPKCSIVYVLLCLFIVCPHSLKWRLLHDRVHYYIHTDAKLEKTQLFACVGKIQFFPTMCFFSMSLLLTQNISGYWMCEGFSPHHQAILRPAVSKNSTLFKPEIASDSTG